MTTTHQQRQLKFRAFHFCGDGMVESEKFCWERELSCMCGAIIMQSTGLHDKNGKEIFEGDVVTGIDANENSHQGEVIFEQASFCLRSLTLNWNKERETLMVWKDGVNRWQSIENLSDFEIIGNIYENPELLK